MSAAASGTTDQGDRANAAQAFAQLLDWAGELSLDRVPVTVLDAAIRSIGDNLAAMIAAADEPELAAAQRQLIDRPGRSEATVFRRDGPRIDARDAALANGLAGTWAELDDGYTKAPSHPGIYSQPALLAIAEAEGATIGAVLRAAIGAYEIGARVARAWSGLVPRWHPHGVFNAITAAAAVSLLRGDDASTRARAVSMAATLVSPGPFDHAPEGALARNTWTAIGASNGILACDWARAGIGGLATSPYDVYTRGFGARCDVAALTDGLGQSWAIASGYHKLYACCHQMHAPLEALAAIQRARLDLSDAAIERIVVEVPEASLHLSVVHPHSTLGAKFSLPHAMAAGVVFGAESSEAFTAGALVDERVARLRERVVVATYASPKAWPLDRPGRVAIELAGGEHLGAACESARGNADRPLSREALHEKIDQLVRNIHSDLAAALDALSVRSIDASSTLLAIPWSDWIRARFQ